MSVPRIRLPEQFDITSVSSICDEARGSLGGVLEIDAAAVSRIDCVALQLLLALKIASGNSLMWVSRSQVITEAARVLDLETALDVNRAG